MRILVIEECRCCATCSEVTPHSLRRVAPWLVLAGGFLALGAAFAAAGGGAFGLLALLPAGLSFSVDRAACWRIACERCRWKQQQRIRARLRASWPDPRNTEICP